MRVHRVEVAERARAAPSPSSCSAGPAAAPRTRSVPGTSLASPRARGRCSASQSGVTGRTSSTTREAASGRRYAATRPVARAPSGRPSRSSASRGAARPCESGRRGSREKHGEDDGTAARGPNQSPPPHAGNRCGMRDLALRRLDADGAARDGRERPHRSACVRTPSGTSRRQAVDELPAPCSARGSVDDRTCGGERPERAVAARRTGRRRPSRPEIDVARVRDVDRGSLSRDATPRPGLCVLGRSCARRLRLERLHRRRAR